MELNRPLRTVTPTVDGDVLEVLARARHAFTPPEVHRVLGERSLSGVRNALERLAAQGVVQRIGVGRAYTYRLREDHLAYPHIVALASLRDELIARVAGRIEQWEVPTPYAALFGSAAHGAMRVDSDIDLFVVRPEWILSGYEPWRDQIDDLEAQVTAWTGNEARVLELSHAEVGPGIGRGDRVLMDIRAHGTRLVGPASYLDDRAAAER